MTARPTPFQAVFAPLSDRFPALRDGITTAGYDPRDRNGFVLVKEVVELLRDLGVEGTMGEGVEELVAFAHAAFLHWLDDEAIVTIDRASLDRLAAAGPEGSTAGVGRSYYLQLPARRVWATAVAGAAPEPIDGWFARAVGGGIDLVAVLGFHGNRPGFTVVQAAGPRPVRLARPDGGGLFSPRLEGGAAAGLLEVTGGEELIELAWRCQALLPPSGAAAGRQGVSWA
ncbi:MAG: hypothetical protein AB7L66_14340 [Gemmatimonadales bacterium]